MDSKYKILVADDVEINRDLLNDILEDSYEVIQAENGQEVIDIVDKTKDISMILLDLMMPVMDGFGVLQELNKRNLMNKIPVIIITGDEDEESISRCSKFGVVDYIRKPFNSSIVQLRVANSVGLFENKNYLEYLVSEQTKELQASNEQLKKVLDQTVALLGIVVEYRDGGSGTHIQRIKSYVGELAKQVALDYPEYNISDEDVDVFVRASLLHDVGKIAVPDGILLKNGRLTDDEYRIIKNHTIDGAKIIKGMEGAWEEKFYQAAYDICRHHHERYNGKGYPDGLAGDDIPISAQIAGVCDCFDALVTKRPYKDPFSVDKAYEMIINGECGVFSEKVLSSFEKVKEQFKAISENNQEE